MLPLRRRDLNPCHSRLRFRDAVPFKGCTIMQEIGKPAVTTSSAPRSHGFRPLRGLQNVSSSEGVTGRFGRMFRNLPVFEQHAEDLVALATSMIQKLETPIDKP